jgi:hypothetical protein
MPIAIVLWLAAAHFVADFVFQSDWVAVNKSKDMWALLAHVVTYSLVMFMLFALWVEAPKDITYRAFAFVGLTAVFHFTTDAITSRITSYLWAKEERHWFFVTIGFDQLLHTIQLVLTYTWLIGGQK